MMIHQPLAVNPIMSAIHAFSEGRTRRKRRDPAILREMEKVTGESLFRSPFEWANDQLIVISGKDGHHASIQLLEEMRQYFLRNGVPEEACQVRHRYYLPTPSEEMILYVMISHAQDAWKLIRTQCGRQRPKLACKKEEGDIPPNDPTSLIPELLAPFLPSQQRQEDNQEGGKEPLQ